MNANGLQELRLESNNFNDTNADFRNISNILITLDVSVTCNSDIYCPKGYTSIDRNSVTITPSMNPECTCQCTNGTHIIISPLCPTNSPSKSPTQSPSNSPSMFPSLSTTLPTTPPTTAPTILTTPPSQSPTISISPTNQPSNSDSKTVTKNNQILIIVTITLSVLVIILCLVLILYHRKRKKDRELSNSNIATENNEGRNKNRINISISPKNSGFVELHNKIPEPKTDKIPGESDSSNEDIYDSDPDILKEGATTGWSTKSGNNSSIMEAGDV